MSELNAVYARSRKGALVIGRGAAIVGSLTVQGEVFVEGTIDGEVRCTTLQITERGVIDGVVVADKAIVLGEFTGEIYAKELILGAGCAVEGQIYHQKLVLEKGCYFEGQSRRHSEPVLLAPPAQDGAPMNEQLEARVA